MIISKYLPVLAIFFRKNIYRIVISVCVIFRSCLDLFGELKCLSCWYDARILLVSQNLEEDISLSKWAKFLSAERCSLEEFTGITKDRIPLWNGLVRIYPNEVFKTIINLPEKG